MRVSLLVIGDELLLGQVIDTNSSDIARTINPYGWEIAKIQIVGDSAAEIKSGIDQAMAVAPIVLVTGGLGPTKDDITKQTLLEVFGGEMILNQEVFSHLGDIMVARGRKMNELTAGQAMVPSSCRVIQNHVGTAPIMWFERDGKVLVSMPGVPFEMREAFEKQVFPQLLERFDDRTVIAHRHALVYGISESDLATRLDEFERALPSSLHLAYLPNSGMVRLRLDGQGHDRQELESEIDAKFEQMVARISDVCLCTEDLTPQELLLKTLIQRNLTVATAESCTGGNIAHLITSIPGSSAAMLGGVVSYANSVKEQLLGVDPEAIAKYGAVSTQVAAQMAEGVRRATGAYLGIATSGIAGPGGGSKDKPVGTVCFGISTPSGTTTYVKRFPGDRQRVIERASVDALIQAYLAVK